MAQSSLLWIREQLSFYSFKQKKKKKKRKYNLYMFHLFTRMKKKKKNLPALSLGVKPSVTLVTLDSITLIWLQTNLGVNSGNVIYSKELK